MGLIAVIKRELRLAVRQAGDSAVIVMFFFLAAIIFPFGIGPEPNMLTRIAPGVVWTTALLAALLSFERLFLPDFEDGSLEQLALSSTSLEIVALGKAVAHWLTTGMPLLIAAPLIGLVYRLPEEGYPVLLMTMILGTPTISLIGTVGAALTLGARRGGVLLSLLILPLVIPVLIFGTAGIDAAIAGFSVKAHLMFLAALLLGSLVIAPLATAAALRQALD